MKIAWSKANTKWTHTRESVNGGEYIEDENGECVCEVMYSNIDVLNKIVNVPDAIELLKTAHWVMGEIIELSEATISSDKEEEFTERNKRLCETILENKSDIEFLMARLKRKRHGI